jgi:hypothetical protein
MFLILVSMASAKDQDFELTARITSMTIGLAQKPGGDIGEGCVYKVVIGSTTYQMTQTRGRTCLSAPAEYPGRWMRHETYLEVQYCGGRHLDCKVRTRALRVTGININ